MNDAQFLSETLDCFVTETPKYIRELERTLAEEDLQSATRAVHSIKGAAGTITADRLRTVAAELEALGKEGQLNALAGRVHELKTELDTCIQYVNEVKEDLATSREK
jgi:HPt (histidine-containing phosphotransfer) domain-containing protein